MKLRHKTLLGFSVVTVVIVLAVSGVGYFNAQKQLQASSEAQMNAVARTYVSEVDGWVHGKTEVVGAVAKMLESYGERRRFR